MVIPVMNRNLPSMPHAQPGLAEPGSVDGAPARLSCRQHFVSPRPGRRSDCRRLSSYGVRSLTGVKVDSMALVARRWTLVAGDVVVP